MISKFKTSILVLCLMLSSVPFAFSDGFEEDEWPEYYQDENGNILERSKGESQKIKAAEEAEARHQQQQAYNVHIKELRDTYGPSVKGLTDAQVEAHHKNNIEMMEREGKKFEQMAKGVNPEQQRQQVENSVQQSTGRSMQDLENMTDAEIDQFEQQMMKQYGQYAE